jgi:hypothetical protein
MAKNEEYLIIYSGETYIYEYKKFKIKQIINTISLIGKHSKNDMDLMVANLVFSLIYIDDISTNARDPITGRISIYDNNIIKK